MEDDPAAPEHPLIGEHPPAIEGRADLDGPQAKRAGRRAGTGLQNPRDRLETGLPGSEIGDEINHDLVVPLLVGSRFYGGSSGNWRSRGGWNTRAGPGFTKEVFFLFFL